MTGTDFILSLLTVSEKAATIARSCRQNDKLLSLLIQEKTELKKNTSFVADFKTLADVLIQELIRYELTKKFPSLKGFIGGEEENVFTNTLGEKVTLVINSDKSNTLTLLTKILHGDTEAAHSLSDSVHKDIPIQDVPVHTLPNQIPELNIDDLAVWIDPIDSTAEYIHGGMTSSNNVPFRGLKCVTVLIGVFSRTTGLPVVGIVNQPFYEFISSDNCWEGRCMWGVSQDGFHANSIPDMGIANEKPLIAVSACEEDCIRKKLEDAGFELISPAGAGNKCLCVVLGVVEAYILSQDTTFYWDTCGCQALLKSIRGNIWNYQEALKGNLVELSYKNKGMSLDVKEYSNKWGLIAYKNEQTALEIIRVLK